MRFGQTLCRAAAAACCVLASQTWAAAPDSIPVAAVPEAPGQSSGLNYALETEMVVHDWVLCISASGAEELARARTESLETARATYANLSGTRACGEFPELRVILREKLYEFRHGFGARLARLRCADQSLRRLGVRLSRIGQPL